MYDKAIGILTEWMASHSNLSGTTEEEYQNVNLARLALHNLAAMEMTPADIIKNKKKGE